jgi:hypothetical protein
MFNQITTSHSLGLMGSRNFREELPDPVDEVLGDRSRHIPQVVVGTGNDSALQGRSNGLASRLPATHQLLLVDELGHELVVFGVQDHHWDILGGTAEGLGQRPVVEVGREEVLGALGVAGVFVKRSGKAPPIVGVSIRRSTERGALPSLSADGGVGEEGTHVGGDDFVALSFLNPRLAEVDANEILGLTGTHDYSFAVGNCDVLA